MGTSGEQPYHKYVFDAGTRSFVGKFEEMYQREEVEGYDSWNQDDLRHLTKQLSLTLLRRYAFSRILDVGCGKGAFTHLLKSANNYVLGIDISPTAIRKAAQRYPDVEFRVMPARQLSSLARGPFDLVVAMEVLSYLEDWRDVLRTVAAMTQYLYLALYLPEAPIGFVKSLDELRAEVSRHCAIVTELLVNHEGLLLLAEVRGKETR